LKTTSILHVNSQSLVLADYGVKTGYIVSYAELVCRVFQWKCSQLHFAQDKIFDTDFATKCENLYACIQYFSMCLAAAEKVLWPIICRLSSNNRPIPII
jgi:hypothetical protein